MGIKKFETLAVFGLAMLLAVLAIEIVIRAIDRSDREVVQTGWGLAVMLGVLVVNTGLAVWERRWAQKLGSQILNADAQHTFADVMTTIVVITGWQLAARGYPWLDTVFALLVMYLAYGLFRRAVPVLVDSISYEPEEIVEILRDVDGVRKVRSTLTLGGVEARGRCRDSGRARIADERGPRGRRRHTQGPKSTLTLGGVEARGRCRDSGRARIADERGPVADAIEQVLLEKFSMDDVTVHIEPDQ